ncbi:hypothetical protein BLNAU_26 [Blattamonas nauphoetae]|uniref:Uncharacterized protein n=1 Tax=Blattamonas nauphoetae TaxID=2049346 RepID=A0ABQ9YLU0_9EUKA|nr:hypothetical protein BLNAU_26 [Blattamonas nauphoetae]
METGVCVCFACRHGRLYCCPDALYYGHSPLERGQVCFLNRRCVHLRFKGQTYFVPTTCYRRARKEKDEPRPIAQSIFILVVSFVLTAYQQRKEAFASDSNARIIICAHSVVLRNLIRSSLQTHLLPHFPHPLRTQPSQQRRSFCFSWSHFLLHILLRPSSPSLLLLPRISPQLVQEHYPPVRNRLPASRLSCSPMHPSLSLPLRRDTHVC